MLALLGGGGRGAYVAVGRRAWWRALRACQQEGCAGGVRPPCSREMAAGRGPRAVHRPAVPCTLTTHPTHPPMRRAMLLVLMGLQYLGIIWLIAQLVATFILLVTCE